ncbi:MAG TPA: DUF2017 family protein [Pseudoclavibacter sp.]|nr:DUF2017 family protein [Pseudoclavibacter sp.]
MSGFLREGSYAVADLELDEREVLAGVCRDVASLLDEDPEDNPHWSEHPLPVPEDPAVLRLLPVGSHDAQAAQEYRRLTELDLRSEKARRLLNLAEQLESDQRWQVEQPHVLDVAAALTDVRLVLAARLRIEDEAQEEQLFGRLESAPDQLPAELRWLATLYLLLGFLEESLLQVFDA